MLTGENHADTFFFMAQGMRGWWMGTSGSSAPATRSASRARASRLAASRSTRIFPMSSSTRAFDHRPRLKSPSPFFPGVCRSACIV